MDGHTVGAGELVRISFGKGAEFQRRGLVHFHILARFDGIDFAQPDAVTPPPEWANGLLLATLFRQAAEQTTFHTPAGHDHNGFFGCIYYAGMRPSEVAALRRSDCYLPETGWGRIVVVEPAPRAGRQWTNEGSTREVRGLKRRGERETRTGPIPPELVRLVRRHINDFEVPQDGRLFVRARGGFISDSVYDRVWKAARDEALGADLARTPMAQRAYDLRHAAVSLWLNAGVPATEVARRVGHSAAVLLSV